MPTSRELTQVPKPIVHRAAWARRRDEYGTPRFARPTWLMLMGRRRAEIGTADAVADFAQRFYNVGGSWLFKVLLIGSDNANLVERLRSSETLDAPASNP